MGGSSSTLQAELEASTARADSLEESNTRLTEALDHEEDVVIAMQAK